MIEDFLEPLDLLASMYLDKNARRVAGRTLNGYQYDVQTQCQQLMFGNRIARPAITGSRVFEEQAGVESSKSNLAGLLRLSKIREFASDLKKNFVILKYDKTYSKENSVVAIFDDQGCLVAICKFSSAQYYESYVDRSVLTGEGSGGRLFNRFGGSNHSQLCPTFYNSGHLDPGAGKLENAWRFSTVQTDFEWQEGFTGYVASPNYALFRLFHGRLSPTETTAVLMHALSSDTRAIYTYVLTMFDYFGDDLEQSIDYLEDEEEVEGVVEWIEHLRSVEYDTDVGAEDGSGSNDVEEGDSRSDDDE